MAVFEGKKSSNGIINNGTMSEDEVVASDEPPRCLFKAKMFVKDIINNDTMSDDEVVTSHVPPWYLFSYSRLIILGLGFEPLPRRGINASLSRPSTATITTVDNPFEVLVFNFKIFELEISFLTISPLRLFPPLLVVFSILSRSFSST